MKNKLKLSLIIIALLIVAIQLVPVTRDNPAYDKSTEIQAPPDVVNILKTSCYDCHSNETLWPYYSYIAPFSWLVADDVKEGRRELNFSTWNTYSSKKQNRKAEEIKEHVSENKMPMPIYLVMHSNAKLSDSQKSELLKWVSGNFIESAAE